MPDEKLNYMAMDTHSHNKRPFLKLKSLQSAIQDDQHGKWRCRHCLWTYPMPNPSSRQRRNHKKTCPGQSPRGSSQGHDTGEEPTDHHDLDGQQATGPETGDLKMTESVMADLITFSDTETEQETSAGMETTNFTEGLNPDQTESGKHGICPEGEKLILQGSEGEKLILQGSELHSVHVEEDPQDEKPGSNIPSEQPGIVEGLSLAESESQKSDSEALDDNVPVLEGVEEIEPGVVARNVATYEGYYKIGDTNESRETVDEPIEDDSLLEVAAQGQSPFFEGNRDRSLQHGSLDSRGQTDLLDAESACRDDVPMRNGDQEHDKVGSQGQTDFSEHAGAESASADNEGKRDVILGNERFDGDQHWTPQLHSDDSEVESGDKTLSEGSTDVEGNKDAVLGNERIVGHGHGVPHLNSDNSEVDNSERTVVEASSSVDNNLRLGGEGKAPPGLDGIQYERTLSPLTPPQTTTRDIVIHGMQSSKERDHRVHPKGETFANDTRVSQHESHHPRTGNFPLQNRMSLGNIGGSPLLSLTHGNDTGEITSVADDGQLSTTHVEYDLERVLRRQQTYELMCPVCGSRITNRIIIRKKRRKFVSKTDGRTVQSTEITPESLHQEEGKKLLAPGDHKEDIRREDGCFSYIPFFSQRGG